jgi:hypothetical protein
VRRPGGISAARQRELAEEALDISIGTTRKYAVQSRKYAAKVGRDDAAKSFDLIVDQLDDISDAVHHTQRPIEGMAAR